MISCSSSSSSVISVTSGVVGPLGTLRAVGDIASVLGVKNTAFGSPKSARCLFLNVYNLDALVADLAFNSLNNHPVIVFPNCEATLEIWIANPPPLPLLGTCVRPLDTLGVGGTGLTCNISFPNNENELPLV